MRRFVLSRRFWAAVAGLSVALSQTAPASAGGKGLFRKHQSHGCCGGPTGGTVVWHDSSGPGCGGCGSSVVWRGSSCGGCGGCGGTVWHGNSCGGCGGTVVWGGSHGCCAGSYGGTFVQDMADIVQMAPPGTGYGMPPAGAPMAPVPDPMTPSYPAPQAPAPAPAAPPAAPAPKETSTPGSTTRSVDPTGLSPFAPRNETRFPELSRPTAPLAARVPAFLTVSVPTDAEVFVDGHKTQYRGATRRFSSPPISGGEDYVYDLRVEITRNGKKVAKTQEVRVRGGVQSTATFTFADAAETELVARVR